MNVMMYYIVYVFEGAGIHDPLLPASIQYISNVVMTLPAILYLDQWGRRPSLILGAFGMMCCLIVSGAVQAVYGEPNLHRTTHNQEVTWLVIDKPGPSRVIIFCSYLFVAIFATTWGPISWTYPAEIFPLKIRSRCVSLSTASNWTWNCALAFAVPPLLREINWRMYIVFATFNGAALVHTYLCAPETKGKTLEEMDEVFDSGRPAWRKGAEGSTLETLQEEIERKQSSSHRKSPTRTVTELRD
jgi:MFS family permease